MIRYGWMRCVALALGGAFVFSGCAAPRAVAGATKGIVKGTLKGVSTVTRGAAKTVVKTADVVTKPLR